MGLPNILIEFKAKASTAIKRGERGIVAVLLIDEPKGVIKLDSAADIPSGLIEANKTYAKRAFWGGVHPIKQCVLIVSDTVENGLKAVETVKFDYLVAPPDVSVLDAKDVAEFIKDLRDSKGLKVKAVLPNIVADHEGIINFTTSGIKVNTDTFTTAQYCSRIAGLLAGTPLQQSCTYHVLPEVDDVPKFTKSELDTKINAGEFCIFHDGERVKVARGVNSLTTIAAPKSEDYKAIKIVDTMDLIYGDILRTCADKYIGKFPNNYDNKCTLIVSIGAYLESLRDEELLDNQVLVSLNLEAQKKYLKSQGVDIDMMNVQQIKEANTQTNVFIQASFKIVNAIEDISIAFYI